MCTAYGKTLCISKCKQPNILQRGHQSDMEIYIVTVVSRMAAFILSMDFITPFDWTFSWGKIKGVRTQEHYLGKLKELCQRKTRSRQDDWIFTWGYHPLFHGELNRNLLDEICPHRPLIVWHRSFHAVHLNSKAIQEASLTKEMFQGEEQVNFDQGHFFERGLEFLNKKSNAIFLRLLPKFEQGFDKVTQIVQNGGITTIADLEVCLIFFCVAII